ncbi:hypothetical protein PMAYCL1PPCAC_14985, partial [Pristionchus mayeri]
MSNVLELGELGLGCDVCESETVELSIGQSLGVPITAGRSRECAESGTALLVTLRRSGALSRRRTCSLRNHTHSTVATIIRTGSRCYLSPGTPNIGIHCSDGEGEKEEEAEGGH